MPRHSGLLTRLLLGALLVCALALGGATSARALTPVGTLITSTCTLTVGSPPAVYRASFDTVVANWAALGPDTTAFGNAGDTVWLSFTASNLAGRSDTFTLAAVSRAGWTVSLWTSGGTAPLAAQQVLTAQQALAFRVAVFRSGSGGSDSVSVGMTSHSDANATDSASASVHLTGQLYGFGMVIPSAVYPGVPFSVTITAFADSSGTVLTTFDTAVAVTVDTGTVTPDTLTAGTWIGGAWTGTLTIDGARDTVYLVVRVGAVAETVAITVANYRIALDKAAYQGLTDLLRITVWDSQQDTPGIVNSVQAQVTSDQDPRGVTVALTETGLTTGIFTGTLGLTEGLSRADAISVRSGNNLTVTYDPDGNGPAPAVAAQASWLALLIQDLERVRSWPNPFRPEQDREIVIHNLPSDQNMTVEIYNVNAQLVKTLRVGAEISVTPQENVARWDGRSGSGSPVASGTYVYVVRCGAGTVVRKLTLIR